LSLPVLLVSSPAVLGSTRGTIASGKRAFTSAAVPVTNTVTVVGFVVARGRPMTSTLSRGNCFVTSSRPISTVAITLSGSYVTRFGGLSSGSGRR
jgi:hypothetical protein